jgi:hydrogenase expression/formation protein HypD
MNNLELVQKMIHEINKNILNEIRIMEICGTHTQNIAKHGIRDLLQPNIQLLSGPGCPVCVTSEFYIDTAIKLLENDETILATFGDLMKVSGTHENLLEQKSKGKHIEVIYSPFDVIKIAENNKNKTIVFLAIGFETTAPSIAITVQTAKQKNLQNLFFLTSLKQMEPILQIILKKQTNNLNGIICPGHVACIKGADYFQFITDDYGIPAVVCGFDAIDIISGIYVLTQQITKKIPSKFENLYKRWVQTNGNQIAQTLINEVFTRCDDEWRGIGYIQNSALKLNKKYEQFDAMNFFNIPTFYAQQQPQCCHCRDILLGYMAPNECPLFANICTPYQPAGPCMVSSEGSCAIYYRYRKDK